MFNYTNISDQNREPDPVACCYTLLFPFRFKVGTLLLLWNISGITLARTHIYSRRRRKKELLTRRYNRIMFGKIPLHAYILHFDASAEWERSVFYFKNSVLTQNKIKTSTIAYTQTQMHVLCVTIKIISFHVWFVTQLSLHAHNTLYTRIRFQLHFQSPFGCILCFLLLCKYAFIYFKYPYTCIGVNNSRRVERKKKKHNREWNKVNINNNSREIISIEIVICTVQCTRQCKCKCMRVTWTRRCYCWFPSEWYESVAIVATGKIRPPHFLHAPCSNSYFWLN